VGTEDSRDTIGVDSVDTHGVRSGGKTSDGCLVAMPVGAMPEMRIHLRHIGPVQGKAREHLQLFVDIYSHRHDSSIVTRPARDLELRCHGRMVGRLFNYAERRLIVTERRGNSIWAIRAPHGQSNNRENGRHPAVLGPFDVVQDVLIVA
jgi:hypothetical protein